MPKNNHKTNKLHIRKGDTVYVRSGNARGKTSKVLKVFPKTYRAIVEGISMVTRHRKPTTKQPQGSVERIEAPIHLSNLMLVEPATGQPTRIGRKTNQKGKLVRYAKKTGNLIENE